MAPSSTRSIRRTTSSRRRSPATGRPTIGLHFDFVYEIDFWNKNGAALRRRAVAGAGGRRRCAGGALIVVTTGIARAYFNLQRLFAQRDVSRAAIVQRDEVVQITAPALRRGPRHQGRGTPGRGRARDGAHRARAVRRADRHRAQPACRARRRGPRARRHRSRRSRRPRLPRPRRRRRFRWISSRRRPDIVASRWRVEASQHDIEVAKALFYPNVNIAAFAGLSSIGLSNFLAVGQHDRRRRSRPSTCRSSRAGGSTPTCAAATPKPTSRSARTTRP